MLGVGQETVRAARRDQECNRRFLDIYRRWGLIILNVVHDNGDYALPELLAWASRGCFPHRYGETLKRHPPPISLQTMSARSPFRVNQCLRGTTGAYKITEQISEFIYFAVYVSNSNALCTRVHIEQQPTATNNEILSLLRASKDIGASITNAISSSASSPVRRLCVLS